MSNLNKKIQNLVWSLRAFWGVTPENKNKKYFISKTRNIIPDYLFKYTQVRKLNIGAQIQLLEGWLSVDIWPGHEGIAYMDATENFPFENKTFDYIFSEHMIEHISYNEGLFMLKECNRVLKKNGKIRIATPSLLKIINNCKDDELTRKYFEKLIRPLQDFDNTIKPNKGYFINYITYNYNHKFIYDEETLTDILTMAGFKNIKFYFPGKSEDIHLQNLEIHHNYLGEEINNFETMVIEAQK